jgi:hypothetical protein
MHIVETGIALLAHSALPVGFWDEAFSQLTISLNACPHIHLHWRKAYENLQRKS